MKIIKLTRGYEAMVDDEDYEMLRKHSWTSDTSHGYVYAITDGGWVGDSHKILRMHKLLMPGVAIVDHADGNTLNNQKSNLRAATRAQNRANCTKPHRGKFRFKGIRKNRGRFAAQIKKEGRMVNLGGFDRETDAACAYDKAAKELHGEFARLNLWRGML